MSEVMTSSAEAARMRTEIMETVNRLAREGFSRGQIGACMAGVGAALVSSRLGRAEAEAVLASIRCALGESP